jgi:hypothetical protein
VRQSWFEHFREPRSIRGDVKNNTSPGTGTCRYPARIQFRRCDFAIPQIHRIVRRRLGFAEQQAAWLCSVPTIVLSETRGLSLFLVVRGGIGFLKRLRCTKHTHGLTGFWILALEPERQRNRQDIPRDEPGMNRLFADAQAACGFRYSASKRTPFFQTSNVMAAILRARVRRARCGFIPRATRVV